MGQPLKPKALKPKAANESGGGDAPAPKPSGGGGGGGGKGGFDLPFIILIVCMMLFSIGGSALTLFLLGPMVLVPAITEQISAAGLGGGEGEHGEGGHGEGEHGEAHAAGHGAKGLGLNLELDDFTVNLKKEPDERKNSFLVTKLSLSVAVPEEQNCLLLASHHGEGDGGGGHGGGHGGGAAADPMETCQQNFVKSMAPYVPTIRDIINTSLMSRTADQVASLEGQEALKDEVIQQTNTVLGNSEYKALRVNLEDFVIQR